MKDYNIWDSNCLANNPKTQGFPGNRRPQPHYTKAVLFEAGNYNYQNEAFKVGNSNQPLPKGPTLSDGMAPCPLNDEQQCTNWVNKIMADAHPDLRISSKT